MATSTEVAQRVGGLTVGALVSVAEGRHVVTADGEIVDVALASDDELVIWSLMTQRLRQLARDIESSVHAELAERVRRVGGAITTDLGDAAEAISRGSVSGIAAKQIRDLLEEAAEDGVIPWDAVDNLAPLVPHVTPQRIHQYAEDAPDGVRDDLLRLVPPKRRTLKVVERRV